MKQIFIYLTKLCPFSCIHCKDNTDDISKVEHQPASYWLKIINDLHFEGVGNVIFGGNECTLYPDLLKLVAKCPLPFELYLSGHPDCAPFIIDNRKAFPDIFKVTLEINHDADKFKEPPKTHSEAKSYYSYQTALVLSKIKGVKVKIRTVVSRLNVSELTLITRKMIETHGFEMEIDFVHFSVAKEHDRYHDTKDWQYQMMNLGGLYAFEKLVTFLDMVYLMTHRHKQTGYECLSYLNTMFDEVLLVCDDVGVTNKRRKCFHRNASVHSTLVSFNPDGSLRVCPYRKSAKKVFLDNDRLNFSTLKKVSRESDKCMGCLHPLPYKEYLELTGRS